MDAFAITPSDTDNLPNPVTAIYSGASFPGSVAVVKPDGSVVVFDNVQPGSTLDVDAIRINADGTTVSGLVGFSGGGRGMDAFALLDVIADPEKAKAALTEIAAARKALADEMAKVSAAKTGIARTVADAERDMKDAAQLADEARHALDNATAATIKAAERQASLDDREKAMQQGEQALQARQAEFLAWSREQQATLDRRQAELSAIAASVSAREASAADREGAAQAMKETYEAKLAQLKVLTG